MTSRLSRRHAIAGGAAVGLGVPLLAACSGDDGDSGASTATDASPSKSVSSATTEGSAGDAGSGLASTSDLEVGDAVFLDNPSIVITAPADGEYKAFSRTCTHQGCPVQDLVDGNIHCNCHNSMFSISDGSPVSGPATQPLQEVPIKVDGDQIVAG